MKVIDRYIGINFLGGCVPVLLLLLSLFGFLALSEELEDVGDGSYELVDALLVTAYSLPTLTVNLLPVTVLLGGLLGLGALANNLELIALRAAAVSPLRISLPIVALSLALIAGVLLLQMWLIPYSEYNATQLRGKTLVEPNQAGLDEAAGNTENNEFWTRNAGQFIRFDRVRPDRSLAGVEIYQFDDEGNLERLLQTPAAELLDDNTWLLYDVYDTRLGESQSQTQHEPTLFWEQLLSEEQTRTLITPASAMAPLELWQSISRLKENNLNSLSQRIIFWTQVSIPIGVLGMSLLALPFLVGSTRSVSVGQRIALGGLIGISYYLVQQISGHLASIMDWNVVATVLAPSVLVLVIAILLLRRAN